MEKLPADAEDQVEKADQRDDRRPAAKQRDGGYKIIR